MKAIITKANENGSFDGVGMNNRIITANYKRYGTIVKQALKFGNGRWVRIEVLNSYNPFKADAPVKTQYIKE